MISGGKAPARRVLIVRLDHLGDVLLTTPLVRAAVRSGAEVHVLVRENCAAPLALNRDLRLHTLEEVAPGFPRGWWRLGAWMRGLGPDTVLLPYAKPPQLLLASAMSGARERLAMWGGVLGRLTLHRCLRSGMHSGARHFSEIPLDCARAAGFPVDGTRPDFALEPSEIDEARAVLEGRFPGLAIVGVHPGCAGNTCNLPAESFGKLAEMILEDPAIAIVGTGIRAEARLFEKWPRAVLDHPRFYNACGQWNLRQLAAHIANYTTMVIPSTGPLHIAAAFGIPTVNAFCNYPPVSDATWGNLTPGTIVVHPPAGFCERRREAGGGNCDFEGRLSLEEMHRAVLTIVAGRRKTNGRDISQ